MTMPTLFKNLSGDRARWQKVSQLRAGMEVAILEGDTDVAWDEIISITPVGREEVFDVEVEGTHNFVGNGIYAHNTALLSVAGQVEAQSVTVPNVPIALSVDGATSTPAVPSQTLAPDGSADLFKLSLYDLAYGQALDARTNWIGVASSTATSTGAAGSAAAPVLTLNAQTGNVGIGTNDPQHTLQVAGEVGAYGFVNTSTRSAKTDIQYLTPDEASSTLAQLEALKPATYTYRADPTGEARLGIIAEDAASSAPEVLSADGKGVDLYKLATFTLTGVQALADKVQSDEVRLAALETRVAALENGSITTASGSPVSMASVASALASAGITFTNGVTTIANLVAAQFTVGSAEKPAGITLYDQQTGAPYCVSVVGGKMTSSPGACAGTATTTGSTASTTPSGASSLTMLGDNPVHVTVGAVFTDPGEVATDLNGQTDPIEVFVNGIDVGSTTPALDTSSPTTYLITYRMIDSTGKSITAIRSVIVGNPDGTVTTQPAASSQQSAAGSTTTNTNTSTASSTPASTNTTPPTVTLKGAAAIQVAQGASFTDPGATAVDASGTDITSSIKETGSVDTTTVGLYTLTYTATDAAGNTASVSRVVSVVAATSTPTTTASSTPSTTSTSTASTTTATSSSTPAS